MSNYYEILGVRVDATQAEIKSAFKRLAFVHHPDTNQGNREAEERFKYLNEAYKTLSNATLRKKYDYKSKISPATPLQYKYHQGGFYRSTMSTNVRKPIYKAPREVFQSKKRDIDFYLFWISLAMLILLGGVFYARL